MQKRNIVSSSSKFCPDNNFETFKNHSKRQSQMIYKCFTVIIYSCKIYNIVAGYVATHFEKITHFEENFQSALNNGGDFKLKEIILEMLKWPSQAYSSFICKFVPNFTYL